MRCNGPVRCAGFGHEGKCRHSSLSGLPGGPTRLQPGRRGLTKRQRNQASAPQGL
jgi:hypothetical protein